MKIKKLIFTLLTISISLGFITCGSDDDKDERTVDPALIIGEWKMNGFVTSMSNTTPETGTVTDLIRKDIDKNGGGIINSFYKFEKDSTYTYKVYDNKGDEIKDRTQVGKYIIKKAHITFTQTKTNETLVKTFEIYLGENTFKILDDVTAHYSQASVINSLLTEASIKNFDISKVDIKNVMISKDYEKLK